MPTVPASASTPINANYQTFNFGDMPNLPDNVALKQSEQANRALLTAGNEAKALGDKIEYDISYARTTERDNELQFELQKISQNYSALNGKEAVDSAEATEQNIQQVVDQMRAGITSPLELRMFESVVANRQLAAKTKVAAHALRQAQIYKKSVNESSLSLAMQSAANSADTWRAGSEGEFALAKLEVVNRLGVIVGNEGYVTEDGKPNMKSAYAKNLVSKTFSAIHESAITNFVKNRRLKEAADYYEKFEGEMSVDTKNKVLPMMSALKDSHQTWEVVTGIEQKMAGKPLTEKLAMLDKMVGEGQITADIRAGAATDLTQRQQIRDKQRNDFVVNLQQTVIGQLESNPDMSLTDIPADQVAALKREGKWSTVIQFANGRQPETDYRKWGEFLLKPSSELAAMTAGQYYDQYRGVLDNSHFDSGLSRIQAAKKLVENPDNPDSVVALGTQIKQAAEIAGVIPRTGQKPNEEQSRAFAVFQETVQRNIAFQQASKNRKLTYEEINEEIQRVLFNNVKFEKKTGWFSFDINETMPAFRAVSLIPTETLQKIRTNLARLGIETSNKNILWAFTAEQNNQDWVAAVRARRAEQGANR